MRIKLFLRADERSHSLSFNYQYSISSAIYKILSRSSPEYADFLHNKGYIGPDGKPRKLFTFSKLFFFPKRKQRDTFIRIAPNSRATLFISSPMLGDFVQHFVIGLFSQQQIEIAGPHAKLVFYIEQVETVAEPQFTSPCRFKALSPIVLTTQIDTPNGLQTHYYRAFEEELPEAVRQSLIRKHETAYGKSPKNLDLRFEIDREYIEKQGGPDRVSKLITIREGFADATKVKGFVAPFTLTGSTELMRTAWECGLGDKCSMGFGCVEELNYG